MDTVTHALSGALIARATAYRGEGVGMPGLRERTITGLLAGAFPDIDFVAGFREFAELPVLYRIDQNSAGTCVWFTDLRLVLPDLTPPFRYGMCRSIEGDAWRLRRLPRNGLHGDNASSHGSG